MKPWPTPTARQTGGRRAQSAGKAWEKTLDTLHLWLRSSGVAVSRCHPQVRVARDGGKVTSATLIGEGPPDYIGTVNVQGVGWSVVFDGKHTEADAWPLADLKLHQAQDLDRHQAAGAVCFLALEYHHRGYVLPWQTLGPLWWAWHNHPGRAARGTASLSAAQIARPSIALPFDAALGWYPPVCALIAGVFGARKENTVQVNHPNPRLAVKDGVIDVSNDPTVPEWVLPQDRGLPALTGLRFTQRAFNALRLLGVGHDYLDAARSRVILSTSEST